MPDGVTKGLWHGVHSREGQMLMCHVLLETGAHWSGLPLHALSSTNVFGAASEVMAWYSMGSDLKAFSLPYLEGLEATPRQQYKPGRHTGIMIDWADGFSRYPQEHKPLNLIETYEGPYILLPNNFVTYKDKHFTSDKNKSQLALYKRNETVYWEE